MFLSCAFFFFVAIKLTISSQYSVTPFSQVTCKETPFAQLMESNFECLEQGSSRGLHMECQYNSGTNLYHSWSYYSKESILMGNLQNDTVS